MTNREDPAGSTHRLWTILSACEITLLLVFLIVVFFFRSSRYAVTAFAVIAAISILVTIVDLVLRRRFRRRQ